VSILLEIRGPRNEQEKMKKIMTTTMRIVMIIMMMISKFLQPDITRSDGRGGNGSTACMCPLGCRGCVLIPERWQAHQPIQGTTENTITRENISDLH
jgi:hypothetical protein